MTAIFIGVDVGAFDHAPGVAGVAGLAFAAIRTALLDGFGDHFARDLGRPFELAGAEVACGQSASFVDDVYQHCGSVRW